MTLTEFLLARIDDDEAAQRRDDAGRCDAPYDVHWDTPRMLAESEAKRRIVDLCNDKWYDGPGLMSVEVMAALALPYADHPDYQPEWKT